MCAGLKAAPKPARSIARSTKNGGYQMTAIARSLKNSLLAAALIAAPLVVATSPASAISVLSADFTVTPNSINEGNSADLSLTFNDGISAGAPQMFNDPLDPGYTASYIGSHLNLLSGGGSIFADNGIDSLMFSIGLVGGQTFTLTATYPTAGDYLPGYSFSVSYQQVDQYLIMPPPGPPCDDEYDVCPLIGEIRELVTSLLVSDQGTAPLRVAALVMDMDPPADTLQTPLPAALPLFASGLGALGVIGWRRKRKHVAAALAAA